MLGTIAFVTIFSAIIVFFVDELSEYVQSLMERPLIFLGFSLVLASALVEMYATTLLRIVITTWIGLLLCVQWLSDYMLGHFAQQLIAKSVVVVLFSSLPITIAYYYDAREKKQFLVARNRFRVRGYSVGLFLWLLIMLLLTLGLPGSDFSG